MELALLSLLGLGGALVLVLDLWAVIAILGAGRPAAVRAAWILAVLALPGVGFVLWLLVGPRPGG